MLLIEKLVDLYKEIKDKSSLPSYSTRKITHIIQLDKEGKNASLLTAAKGKDALALDVPYCRRSRNIRPYLVVDKPDYSLGLGDTKDVKHKAFVDLVEECYNTTKSADILAVLTFLRGEEFAGIKQKAKDDDIKDTSVIAFMVEDRYPWQDAAVGEFWDVKFKEASLEGCEEMECLICGETKPVIQRHPVDFVLGGGRTVLVSANQSSAYAYGREAAEVAPMCFDCSCAHSMALRYLLASPNNHFSTSAGVYVFWARKNVEFDMMDVVNTPKPENVATLLRSPYTTLPADVLADDFYAAYFTRNSSRVVVRNLVHTTVKDVVDNLVNFFKAQEVPDYLSETRYYSIRTLLLSIVRDAKDLNPKFESYLYDFAVTGRKLPIVLLDQAISRLKADQERRLTRPRVALMRMVINSNLDLFEGLSEVTVGLNKDETNFGYVCGRLLYICDRIQHAAIPGLEKTFGFTQFNALCAAPALTIAYLLNLTRAHLGKLKSTRPGLCYIFENQLTEVISLLPSTIPAVMGLFDPAHVGVAYYQQRDDDTKQRAENAKKKAEENESTE